MHKITNENSGRRSSFFFKKTNGQVTKANSAAQKQQRLELECQDKKTADKERAEIDGITAEARMKEADANAAMHANTAQMQARLFTLLEAQMRDK